jgi:uncharacterized protein
MTETAANQLHEHVSRPFPEPVLERFAPHFEALRRGELLVRRCEDCGRVQWPPRVCCRACNSERLAWIEAAREGVIYTFTVCYRAFHPWFAQRTPFGLVVADVEPGARVLGSCFSRAVESLACGQRVRADFSSSDDGNVVLVWEPIGP